jgi:general secretion pathway protein J
MSFAYAGPDRIWKSGWQDSDKLPAMIRLTVRDAATGRVLSVSTVAPVHVQVSSDCARSEGGCDDKTKAPQKAPDETRPGIAAAGQGASL